MPLPSDSQLNILALYDVGRSGRHRSTSCCSGASDGQMMSVMADGSTAAFRAATPRALFQTPLASFVSDWTSARNR
jgi:hypothetical protein